MRTWRHIAKQSSLFRPTNRASVGRKKLQRVRSYAVIYTWAEFFAFGNDGVKTDFVPKHK